MSVATSVKCERPAYSHAAQPVRCMASLRASECTPRDRSPVDLVLVIDKSGSMKGEKMKLTKETAELVAKELGATDRLSIITYDSDVTCSMPLSKMDSSGKRLAREAIASIHPGSATNLSGGLMRGLEELNDVTDPAETTSVLLMTDGLANRGITDTSSLVSCVESILAARSAPCTVFTFGYGADHDAEMLRSISDGGGGQYYHMEDGDAVVSSFADCLGGLLSVVAQNVKVQLQARGAAITKVLGQGYKTTADADTAIITVNLGDLYSEEFKDILFEVALPAGEGTVDVTTSLSYLDVVEAKLVTAVEAQVAIARAEETSTEPDIQVVEQGNRVDTVTTIKEANELARQGRYAEGSKMLEAAIQRLSLSAGAAGSALTAQLVVDLTECKAGMQDYHSFSTMGDCSMQTMMQSHAKQRVNRCTPKRSMASGKDSFSVDSPYDTSSKRAMRQSWQSPVGPTSAPMVLQTGGEIGRAHV